MADFIWTMHRETINRLIRPKVGEFSLWAILHVKVCFTYTSTHHTF